MTPDMTGGTGGNASADSVTILKTVKGIFDPARVMNRGKLCFNDNV